MISAEYDFFQDSIEVAMLWTDVDRAGHSRSFKYYPSNPTGADWAVIPPLVPPSRANGCPDMREVMNANLYIAGAAMEHWC